MEFVFVRQPAACFDVITEIVMFIEVFWDVTLSRQQARDRRFGQ